MVSESKIPIVVLQVAEYNSRCFCWSSKCWKGDGL